MAPLSTRTLDRMPATGAGNSTVALSVSMTARLASRSTRSPTFLSHCTICTSVMDSPTWGTISSTAMSLPRWNRLVRVKMHYAPGNPQGRTSSAVHLGVLEGLRSNFRGTFPESLGDQLLLLQLVAAGRARRRGRRRRPVRTHERMASQDVFAQKYPQVAPGAHVLRLFLDPGDRGALGVGFQGFRHGLGLQGIELFQAQDGDIVPSVPGPLLVQLVIQLAAAHQDPLHLFRGGGVVRQDAPEAARGQLFQG